MVSPRFASALFAASILFLQPVRAQETLTNASVLQMLEVGLPTEAVVAKIKASRGTFDTSTEALIDLKNKGVPGPVLAAMLEPANTGPTSLSEDSPDPTVPHYPGVYMLGEKDQKMYRMVATASNQAKTGGILGYAFTAGIATKPGVFKVTPSQALSPGEYGFIQALTGGNVSGGGGAMTARVFDFGIGG